MSSPDIKIEEPPTSPSDIKTEEPSSEEKADDLPLANIPDGWQACYICKKIGIKDSYYGKNKVFCSISCSKKDQLKRLQRSQSATPPPTKSILFRIDDKKIIRRKTPSTKANNGDNGVLPMDKDISTIIRMASKKQKRFRQRPPQTLMMEMMKRKKSPSIKMPSLVPLLNLVKNGAFNQVNPLYPVFESYPFAPVDAFHHAPLHEEWSELINKNNKIVVDIQQQYKNTFWRAEIVNAYGYFLKLRHLGPSTNSNCLFLINFRLRKLLPIIKRNENGKIVKRDYCPPNFMRHASVESLFTLPKQCSTIDCDLHSKFMEYLDYEYDKNCLYEVVDHTNPSRMVCCKIVTKFGDWLGIQYVLEADSKDSNGILPKHAWVHPKSGMFRLMGWSQLIGYPSFAPKSYLALALYALTKCDPIIDNYLDNPEAFPFEPNIPNMFLVGSYLEFLDPFAHKMKIAKVYKKLRYGFMILEYDNPELKQNEKSNKIFQHVTSRLIFPIGHCAKNDIPLYTNNNSKYNPNNTEFKEEIESKAASKENFPHIENMNLFRPNMVLETFHLVGKGLISYAFVERVCERLLSLRFINHGVHYQLWVEYTSPHLRPFGFTHLLNFDNTMPLFPIFIDNIRFAELHIKINEFKISLREFKAALNADVKTNENNFKLISSNLNPQIIMNNNSQESKPSIKVFTLNSSKFGYSRVIVPSSPSNIKDGIGNYVRYPQIKINTVDFTIDKENSSNRQTKIRINPKTGTIIHDSSSRNIESISELSPINFDSDLSLSDRALELVDVQMDDDSEVDSKGSDLSFQSDESDELSSSDFEDDKFIQSKRARFVRFKRKVKKILRISKSTNLNGLPIMENCDEVVDVDDEPKGPFDWTPDQVCLFLKNNLSQEHLEQLNLNSIDIDGQQFLRMDYFDYFNSKLLSMRPSMSLALRLSILKLCLVEHLKLDLDDIFPEEAVADGVFNDHLMNDCQMEKESIKISDDHHH